MNAQANQQELRYCYTGWVHAQEYRRAYTLTRKSSCSYTIRIPISASGNGRAPMSLRVGESDVYGIAWLDNRA